MDNAKIADRQVEFHGSCFLFGHYDSRGGATLLVASGKKVAFKAYGKKAFELVEDSEGNLHDPEMKKVFDEDAKTGRIRASFEPETYEDWRKGMIQGIEESLMFPCVAIFCDAAPKNDQDLDHGYDENGYRYGMVQYREKTADGTSKWKNVRNPEKSWFLLFWRGKRPTLNPAALGLGDNFEVRISKREFGEDAFGVLWFDKS